MSQDPADDPMFGGIVRGSNEWHQTQQDNAHQPAGAETLADD
jgi:hypothetical protein